MTEIRYVFSPAPRVAIPVLGSDALFPVRRVYCVGRNYAEHIREMGGDERQPPFFFQKPTDAIVLDGAAVPYPTITSDFQHEIELVLAIGRGGSDIAPERAADHVFGQAVGIDLTRRDVQVEARKTGRPWEIGKGFDQSAPIGLLHPTHGGALLDAGNISLTVNDEVRQSGDLAQMIWNSAEIISQLSRQYHLEPGDLIYTGTPAGVGPIEAGDVVKGHVADLTPLSMTVAGR
ncbi:fumarylacetoacetate hydrolase family protein [Sphingobium sp.]|uniref:fumarylacetoacetate hydrolase family protein n=1 Tax=Sphingobium sp. TaxID=1912891 RepID=UPI0028BECD1B|nr:fumarylacetoacetate hydrolase family protein [Sphingobium sp.]